MDLTDLGSVFQVFAAPQFNSIQFVYFAINQKIQHKYIIDDTQYSYYYNVHT